MSSPTLEPTENLPTDEQARHVQILADENRQDELNALYYWYGESTSCCTVTACRRVNVPPQFNHSLGLQENLKFANKVDIECLGRVYQKREEFQCGGLSLMWATTALTVGEEDPEQQADPEQPQTVAVWSGDADDEIVFTFQAPHSKIEELVNLILPDDDPTFPHKPRKIHFTRDPGGIMVLKFVGKEAMENRVGEMLRKSQKYGFEVVLPAQQADQQQQANQQAD